MQPIRPTLALEQLERRRLLAITFTEFSIPTAGATPTAITAGPDGNLWFVETSTNKIGRITPAGTVTEFPIPDAASQPRGISAGPDGRLWFTEYARNRVGRINTNGTFLPSIPLSPGSSNPLGIAAGADGNIWVGQSRGGLVAKITPAGAVTNYIVPNGGSASHLAAGPDGNIWFTETGKSRVGRVTPGGVMKDFVVPSPGSAFPNAITTGPDGNLWFTQQFDAQLGRITTAGTLTEFFTPHSDYSPYGIAAGADGNLWFINEAYVGRSTTAGAMTDYFRAETDGLANAITAGPDGNLWYVFSGRNKVGRVNLGITGASVHGNVFNDLDADGVKDAGEFALPAWRVFVDANKNGIRDATEKTAVTDATGGYHLTGLAAGTHRVRVIRPAGYRSTNPSSGYLDLTLTAGQKLTGKNFASTQKVLIAGTVFRDTDGDKIKDAGETGLSGWRVFIDADNDGVFDASEKSVLTDAGGNYRFTTLAAGAFVLRVVKPSGYNLTTPGSYTFTLSAGASTTKLFGARPV
ncbi:MAG: virginiamycin lyase [Phycisphaerales bacterium]|nr:virginiamycin lyase [Phycisphaerales bacterium]